MLLSLLFQILMASCLFSLVSLVLFMFSSRHARALDGPRCPSLSRRTSSPCPAQRALIRLFMALSSSVLCVVCFFFFILAYSPLLFFLYFSLNIFFFVVLCLFEVFITCFLLRQPRWMTMGIYRLSPRRPSRRQSLWSGTHWETSLFFFLIFILFYFFFFGKA